MNCSMCGIECGKCDFLLNNMCKGCHAQLSKVFWGECPVAKCVMDKGYHTCAECDVFPCGLLKSFSYDKEHGDNGQRIKNLQSM